MNNLTIMSTGGLGDGFICFLKILPYTKTHNIRLWFHGTGQTIHIEPISQLMQLLPGIGSRWSCNKITKQSIKEIEPRFMEENPDCIRLNTVAREIQDPTPDLSLICGNISRIPYDDYVIIQPGAGRINDASYRHIVPSALEKMCKKYLKKYMAVVLLGAPCKFQMERVVNLTNKTTISEAINICNRCKEFVGFHGFLAYTCMSMSKPATLFWDDANLPNHYMHPKWRLKTREFLTPRTIINGDFI